MHSFGNPLKGPRITDVERQIRKTLSKGQPVLPSTLFNQGIVSDEESLEFAFDIIDTVREMHADGELDVRKGVGFVKGKGRSRRHKERT